MDDLWGDTLKDNDSNNKNDTGLFGGSQDNTLNGLFEESILNEGNDTTIDNLFGSTRDNGNQSQSTIGGGESTFGDLFQNDDWNSPNQEERATSLFIDKTRSDGSGSTSVALVPAEDLEELEYPSTSVTNRIAAVDLCCKIDLRKLTISLRNCEYNPARATAGTIRWPTDGESTIVFRVHPKGRMVILCGPMPLDEVKVYAKKCAFLIKKIGHPKVKFRGFKSITILGQFQCEFPIRLESLYADHRDFATYEPELMPALVYRFPSTERDSRNTTRKKRVANEAPTIQVYVTGRCIISGCNKEEKMEETVRKLFPVLRQYRS